MFNMITFGTSTVISGSQKIIDQIKKELDGIKRDCPFDVKKLGKEDIFEIDDIEIYDNALCQGEASSLNEMAYIALDSGNNYLLQDFTNRPMNDQIGSFIKLTGISVDQHQMISVELINKPCCRIDCERGTSNNQ